MAKKLLAWINNRGRVGRTYVIPDITRRTNNEFIGVERLLGTKKAAVVFVGTDITTQELLDRFWPSPERVPVAEAVSILDEFLRVLGKYQLGNVMSVSYDMSGRFTLQKGADLPPTDFKPKLPD